MSSRKKIILAGLLVAIAILIAAAGMYSHEMLPAGRQTVIRQTNSGICKAVLYKSRKIPENTDPLPRQPNAAICQEGKKDRENAAEGSEKRAADDIPYAEEAVVLSDIYSESGKEAVFSCFNREAASYRWEIYDLTEKEWKPALETAVSMAPDELGREVSWFKVSGSEEITVRCTVKYDGKEDEIQTASLYLLEKSIAKIATDNYVTTPGDCVNVKDIPITVTYKDRTEETLKGLNGLFFLTEEEKKEHITGIGGNEEETTTTTVSERSYTQIGQEKKEIRMRYNGSGNVKIETICTITGEDALPPIISSVEIAPFTVSNIDIPVTLTVTIDAEDNKTPNQRLDYAFVLSDTLPDDTSWTRKSSFDVEIVRNGTYAAYVRDEAGNITETEITIDNIDREAPVIQGIHEK